MRLKEFIPDLESDRISVSRWSIGIERPSHFNQHMGENCYTLRLYEGNANIAYIDFPFQTVFIGGETEL